jgi:hypothetical protein
MGSALWDLQHEETSGWVLVDEEKQLHDLNQRELAGDASGDSGLHGNDVRVMDKAVGDHQLLVKFVWKLVQGPW